MNHAVFVAGAFAITAAVLALLAGWIVRDFLARKKELQALEAQGIRSHRRASRNESG